FAGLHVPQAQVLAAGGQGFAIGGKGKGQHRPPPPDTAALEAADLLARGCIPKKDSAAGQQLTVANIGAGENLAVGRTGHVGEELALELAEFLSRFHLPQMYPRAITAITQLQAGIGTEADVVAGG